MKLFIDDVRPCPDGWESARTNTRAIRILATMPVDEISIDHDIQCQMASISGQPGFSHTSNETYMPVVYYILAMARELRPKRVFIHTANIYCGKIMMEMLEGQVDDLKRDYTFGEDYMNERDFKQGEDWRRRYE